VHAGHNEVEKNKIRLLGLGDRYTVEPVVRFEDGESFLDEVMRVKAPQEIFVVNDKYFLVQAIPANG